MDSISISKNEFVDFVTNGYPIDLTALELEELFNAFIFYVNSDDNSFSAEYSKEGVIIYAGMRTEVCKISYEDDKITILTAVTEELDDQEEFTAVELHQILAQACHGIVVFVKTYEIATGRFGDDLTSQFDIPEEKMIGDNTKFKPWPIKGA